MLGTLRGVLPFRATACANGSGQLLLATAADKSVRPAGPLDTAFVRNDSKTSNPETGPAALLDPKVLLDTLRMGMMHRP
jgi:hypothetical protein